jgi:hypothetical protein
LEDIQAEGKKLDRRVRREWKEEQQVSKSPYGYSYYHQTDCYQYRDLITISWDQRRAQLKLGRAKRRNDRRWRRKTARRQKRYPEEAAHARALYAQLEEVLEKKHEEERSEEERAYQPKWEADRAEDHARSCIQLRWDVAAYDNTGWYSEWDSDDDRLVELDIRAENDIWRTDAYLLEEQLEVEHERANAEVRGTIVAVQLWGTIVGYTEQQAALDEQDLQREEEWNRHCWDGEVAVLVYDPPLLFKHAWNSVYGNAAEKRRLKVEDEDMPMHTVPQRRKHGAVGEVNEEGTRTCGCLKRCGPSTKYAAVPLQEVLPTRQD